MAYGINWILDIVVQPIRSSWNVWGSSWLSRSRCWLLIEEVFSVMTAYSRTRKSHTRVEWEMDDGVYRSFFGVSDEIQDITRSPGMVWRISFYIWKVVLRFWKSLKFFGMVPGRFQKVPEGQPVGPTPPGGANMCWPAMDRVWIGFPFI